MQNVDPPEVLVGENEVITVGPPPGVSDEYCMTIKMVKREIKGGPFDGQYTYSTFAKLELDATEHPEELENLVIELIFYGIVPMHSIAGWYITSENNKRHF